jgi:uncharacterized Zn finger protein (UPF0148 family)
MSRRRPAVGTMTPPCPKCWSRSTIQIAEHLDERTFFCAMCEHTWSVEDRSEQTRPLAAPIATERPATYETRDNGQLRARLAATIDRATTVMETCRALQRLSRHRRELRQLARLALRPQ